MKKRLFTFLASFLLVFLFVPTVVFADDPTALTGDAGTLTSGSYYLSGDVTLSGNIIIASGTEVTLDLNDHTLTTGSYYIDVRGTLTLTDNGTYGSGKITGGSSSHGVVQVYGSCTMTGGSITGNSTSGVFVSNNASFTMSGGTISGNSASNGGGVSVNYGSFTMNGGTISGNSASNAGGGVYVAGSNGSFTLNSGTISGNSAGMGGGIYVGNSSTFAMNGGSIASNTASAMGGGVYNVSTFKMTAGTIFGNSTSIYGGGVYNSGSFTMSGGTITSNSAPYSYSGCGVFDSGTLIVSGSPVITGNTMTGTTTEQNVYLQSGKYITLGGELSGSASIGVTTYNVPTDGSPVQITTQETSTEFYGSAVSYFSSDNTSYYVLKNSSKYLELSTPIALTETDFTVDTATETYTGSTITKSITSDLTEGTDYEVSYSANVNAGTATITITGKGAYNGTLTWEFTIEPKTISASLTGTITKVYDGTTALPDDNTLSVILGNDVADIDKNNVTVSAESITYQDADVGTTKVLVVTGLSLSGSAAGNYKLSSTSMNVGASAGMYVITVADQSISYSTDIVSGHAGDAAFTNDLTQTTVYGEVTYASDDTDVATVDENGEVTIVGAGTAKITATAAGSGNYNEATASYTLTVTPHSYEDAVTDPTCTEQGYTTHTCSLCRDSYTDSYTDAAGHSYSDPTFTWSEDGKSCTVTFTCAACGDVQTLEATVTSAVKTEATTTANGVTTYMATVTFNGVVYTVTKDVADIPAVTDSESEETADDETVDSYNAETTIEETTETSAAESAENPHTGDSNQTVLWVSLLLISGFGIIAGIVFAWKRKIS